MFTRPVSRSGDVPTFQLGILSKEVTVITVKNWKVINHAPSVKHTHTQTRARGATCAHARAHDKLCNLVNMVKWPPNAF